MSRMYQMKMVWVLTCLALVGCGEEETSILPAGSVAPVGEEGGETPIAFPEVDAQVFDTTTKPSDDTSEGTESAEEDTVEPEPEPEPDTAEPTPEPDTEEEEPCVPNCAGKIAGMTDVAIPVESVRRIRSAVPLENVCRLKIAPIHARVRMPSAGPSAEKTAWGQ